jgi:hypothetical protein
VDVANGTLQVIAPTNVQHSVTFTAITGTTGTLSFQEVGLVSGVSWTSIVAGVGAVASNATLHSYTLPTTGNPYTYYIATQVGYTATPNNGTASTGATVGITFTGLLFSTYAVTLTPLGLTGTDTFTVTMGGFTNSSTTGGSVVFWEANGTYPFTLSGPSGVTPIATSGLATVAGMAQTIQVPFAASPMTTTFTESGLVGGPQWGVTITTYTGSGATGYNFTAVSTGTTLAFALAGSGSPTVNVTYNWTTVGMSGWMASPAAGNVSLNSTAVINAPTITYSLVTYPVTIFEVGLPATSLWAVNATFTYPGTSTSGYATGHTHSTAITVALPNGTASVSVSGPAGYTAQPVSVAVSAGPTAGVAVFSIVPYSFSVTFTASGLSGSWTVYFNGVSKSGTGAISFSAPNGTYTYAVVVPSGQVATPSGGTVTVNGTSPSVSVSVKGAPSGGTSVPTWAYAVIGVFVVLTLIFLATTLMARRRPPTPPAPQSWTPGPSTTETKSGEGGPSPPPSS